MRIKNMAEIIGIILGIILGFCLGGVRRLMLVGKEIKKDLNILIEQGEFIIEITELANKGNKEELAEKIKEFDKKQYILEGRGQVIKKFNVPF